MSTDTPPAFDPYDPLGLDASLSADETAVRDTVRKFCAEHVTPYVAGWFEDGDLPVARELAKQFGELGLLGMHLHGYGCGGPSLAGGGGFHGEGLGRLVTYGEVHDRPAVYTSPQWVLQ